MSDPLPGWGLLPVELAHQALFDRYFSALKSPLSDYTFSQLFTWRNSLRILWREIDGHLCVFANGAGDLTLLLPPISTDGASPGRATREAFALMDQYNAEKGVPKRSRIEYASEELLGHFDEGGFSRESMGTDYVYDVNRMIDLAGGDLKSKRQEKNRFMRNYEGKYSIETYDPAKHFNACLGLLDEWKIHQDAAHLDEANTNSIKRQKESLACELSLRHAQDLGLRGMVVHVDRGHGPSVRAFTFGEKLGTDASSIVIEKTDLEIKGLAQFIFSEFCRTEWADRPLVNVGDDWGLESLAWTKTSYRPVKLMKKFVLRQTAKAVSTTGFQPVSLGNPDRQDHGHDARGTVEPLIRPAAKHDVPVAAELEKACFSTYSLGKRQLQYLQQSPNSVFIVAEQGGSVVGDGIALLRHHKSGMSGRLYSLAVHPDQRGKGLGEALLRRMMAELVGRGVRRVYLEVESINTAAIHLYEKNGFRSIGTLADYYGDGRDGTHMVCELSVREPSLVDSVAA